MPWQHRKEGDLHFVDGLLAVNIDTSHPDERRSLLNEVLGVTDGQPASPDQLEAEFGDIDMVNRVTEHIDVISVGDPAAAADSLTELEQVTASPIHALGFSWHRPYSATPPSDLGGLGFPKLSPGAHDRVIAVVDTGVVDPGALPGWVSSSLVLGQDDIEDLTGANAVSHGTFVTSLIRQVAPTHVVSMARAAAYEGASERSSKKHPEPWPTTEFHVADAILRLIERHRGDCSVEALNLSIGGPSLSRRAMATIQAFLGLWRETFVDAPIFAAAGNSPAPDPIYPAAFRYVRGVSAGLNGRQITWDSKDQPTSYPNRDWVDDVAPGSELIGLSGRGPNDAISWSGSSFASAVATASYVRRGPVAVRRGVAWWPDRPVRYGNVPGLRFI